MQDIKLNASATLIDPSMSPYAGELRRHRLYTNFTAHLKITQTCLLRRLLINFHGSAKIFFAQLELLIKKTLTTNILKTTAFW